MRTGLSIAPTVRKISKWVRAVLPTTIVSITIANKARKTAPPEQKPARPPTKWRHSRPGLREHQLRPSSPQLSKHQHRSSLLLETMNTVALASPKPLIPVPQVLAPLSPGRRARVHMPFASSTMSDALVFVFPTPFYKQAKATPLHRSLMTLQSSHRMKLGRYSTGH